MADLGKIDFSQYASWERVVAPDGHVYYVPPGGAGYLYDPFASQLKGRPVLFVDPRQSIAKQKKAEDDIKKQQEKLSSPVNQIAPVAGAVAGTVGATYAVKALTPATVAGMVNTPNGVALAMSDGTIAGPGAAAQAATQAATPASSFATAANPALNYTPVSGVAPSTAVPVGPVRAVAPEAANTSAPWFGTEGSVYNTSGMIGPEGSFAPLNVAGALYGGYGTYEASQAQNKRAGITSGVAHGALAGMSIGGPAGAAIGAIVGGLAGAAAHETTAHRAQRRFGELGQSGGTQDFQDLVAKGMEESLSGADTWDLGDDRSKAPIDLMTRSYGVLKTFGPQWATLSDAQRQSIVRGLVDNDLLNSKQGDYLIDDPGKAQEIFNAVINGAPMPKNSKEAFTAQALKQPVMASKPLNQQGMVNLPGQVPAGTVPQVGAQTVALPVSADPNHPVGIAAIQSYINGARAQHDNFGFGGAAGGAMRPQTYAPGQAPSAPVVTIEQPKAVEPVKAEPARSQTKSPGIGKDGRTLSIDEMANMLAKRMDRR